MMLRSSVGLLKKKEQMNNYFRHIEHAPLANWNRGVMYFNIYEDEGKDAAQKYVNGLTIPERESIVALLKDIRKRGKDVVQRELMRNMPLQDDGQPWEDA